MTPDEHTAPTSSLPPRAPGISSICLQRLLTHSISHMPASIPVSTMAYYIQYHAGWQEERRREGRREGGRGEDGKGAAGRRRTERKFQNCRCLVIALTSPPPTRQLQNTHWKAVTKFSHIGFVSVLKPKKKKIILCVSFPVPRFLTKAGWACIWKPTEN